MVGGGISSPAVPAGVPKLWARRPEDSRAAPEQVQGASACLPHLRCLRPSPATPLPLTAPAFAKRPFTSAAPTVPSMGNSGEIGGSFSSSTNCTWDGTARGELRSAAGGRQDAPGCSRNMTSPKTLWNKPQHAPFLCAFLRPLAAISPAGSLLNRRTAPDSHV